MNVNTEKTKLAGRAKIEKQLLSTTFLTEGGLAEADRKNRFETHLRGTNDMMSVADIQFTRAGVLRVQTDQEYLGRRVIGVGAENVPFAATTRPQYGGRTANLVKLSAGMDVSYESMLENIESKGYIPGLIDRFMQKAALDISEWVVNADTASADPVLALADGFGVLTDDSYILDAQGSEIGRDIFHAGFRALPKEMRRRKNQLRWFANTLLMNNWVETYGDRATIGGDSATRGQVISPDGIPFVNCDEIADDLNVLFTAATYGKHVGTVYDPFVITAANSDIDLDAEVAGGGLLGPQNLTVAAGTYTAPELANALNIQAVAAGLPAVFHAYDGRLGVRTTLRGAGNRVVIAAGAANMLPTVGMTADTYPGAAAAADGVIAGGTYAMLTTPANFRVYISEDFRTTWEYQARPDRYEFTMHFYSVPYLVEPASLVKVTNLRLRDYR